MTTNTEDPEAWVMNSDSEDLDAWCFLCGVRRRSTVITLSKRWWSNPEVKCSAWLCGDCNCGTEAEQRERVEAKLEKFPPV